MFFFFYSNYLELNIAYRNPASIQNATNVLKLRRISIANKVFRAQKTARGTTQETSKPPKIAIKPITYTNIIESFSCFFVVVLLVFFVFMH